MDSHIDFSVYLMRENAKSGRSFFRFFEKISNLFVFHQLQGENFTATKQNSFFRAPYAVEAALIFRDLDEVDSKKLHRNN